MGDAIEATVEAEVASPAPEVIRAVVIVGVGALPKDGRLTIVCEARPDGQPVTSGYPAGADLYFRTDDSVSFPKKAPVVTLGVDAAQGSFRDFSSQPGVLNFAGAHPAYAAANLAFQRGATAIEIVGLTDAEKDNLRPSFDELPSRGFPVAVSLT